MRKKITGIYKIVNIVNNKMYIGSARCTSSRKSQHFMSLKKNKHRNPYLQKAYNKYGKENFKFEILEICENTISEQDLRELEDRYIIAYNSMAHQNGYNLLKADRKILSKRHREILLELNKKSNVICNKIVYQYSLDGIFICQYKSINEATKALFPEMSEIEITNSRKGGQIGCVCNGNRKSAFGYLWSFEKKLSLTPVKTKPYKRRVVQYDLNGNKLNVFESLIEAGKILNIKSGTIYNGLIRNQIVAGKYKFKDT